MKKEQKPPFVFRDISWLAFNARVLQEAADPRNPTMQRIRFLGIFSNNLDEFFRVRVATLNRMIAFRKKISLPMQLEKNPTKIMNDIYRTVIEQQREFTRIWTSIISELKSKRVFIKNEKQLSKDQKAFVRDYYDVEVENNIIPLMIESIKFFPALKDKAIYLAVLLQNENLQNPEKYAIIEIPSLVMNRFVKLPSKANETHLILLEDVIRFSLPHIFSHLGYTQFQSWIFKVTRDAELDIDNDIQTNLIQKIEDGLKRRKMAQTVRMVYDKEMDPGLLKYLSKRLDLNYKNNLIPGGRIHNFRDFMNFPNVLKEKVTRRQTMIHPKLSSGQRVSEVVLKEDLLLCFPYHHYDSIIDFLRESAMDADVASIQITAYRLSNTSKVMNALINAARNGKKVTVVLELRARFDEEANLVWKSLLEEEGIRVLVGIPNMKVHCKIAVVTKKTQSGMVKLGFVSTGNLNEKTAKVYADVCLLTSDKKIMKDCELFFKALEQPFHFLPILKKCKTLLPSPEVLRKEMVRLIDHEIKQAKDHQEARIILKMNSLSDEHLINKLYDAASAGVEIHLIIRGICCLKYKDGHVKKPIHAMSIVDEYLEHSRIFYFYHGGHEKMFISSADWMTRNLDYRVEATTPIINKALKEELKTMLRIQLSDNMKARVLDKQLSNSYVQTSTKRKIQSQVEYMRHLIKSKPLAQIE